MKVATWRVRGVDARLDEILAWLDEKEPTVVCLQGTGVRDGDFPLLPLFERGYFTKLLGGTGRAGLAIVSTEPPREVTRNSGSILTARIAGVWFVNAAAPDGVGLADGHPRFDERLAQRLRFFEELTAHASGLARSSEGVVVAGDLGVSPNGDEITNRAHWDNRLGAHAQERAALGALRRVGLDDLWGPGASRATSGAGLRTDLILGSARMRERLVTCEIAADMPLEPAAHAPVLTVFDGISLSGLGPGVLPE